MTTDPFAQSESNPSISFQGVPPGTTISGRVLEVPTVKQDVDFDTRAPLFWPDGNPKLVVITTLDVNGTPMGLWARKPSAMFNAIAEATKATGKPVEVGGTLAVTFTGEKPNETKPWLNPQKLFSARYTPPNAFAGPAPSPAQTPPIAGPQAAAPQTAPTSTLTAAGPSPEQVAALRSAGVDPATIYPGWVDPNRPPF